MDTLRLFGLVALIVSVAACSESLAPPPPQGGSSGTGATGATGGSGATGGNGADGGSGGSGGRAGTGGASGMSGAGGSGGMSGGGGTGGVGGMSPNSCTTRLNDTEVIRLTTPNLRYWAARCATTECSHDDERMVFIECVTTCVQRDAAPSNQLSTECGTCYGELAWCAGAACNTLCSLDLTAICDNVACIGGATGVVCDTYSDCLATLNHCAGRDSLDCEN